LTTNDALLDEILVRGLDDWIQACEVQSCTIEVCGAHTGDEMRRLSLAIIRHALELGLVRVGDVTTGAFRPWPGDVDAIVRRVEREWMALEDGPNLGDVCWLANTPAGDERARRVLRARKKLSQPASDAPSMPEKRLSPGYSPGVRIGTTWRPKRR